jgi:hypothetical protein
MRPSSLLALVFLALAATAANAQELSLYEKIDKAIEKGVAYLKTCQKADGSFGDVDSETLYGGGTGKGYPHQAGLAAFALYALLKSGVPPNDPVVNAGFGFILQKAKTESGNYKNDKGEVVAMSFKTLSSYELSAMILALEARYNPHKKESIRVTLEKAKARAKNRIIEKAKPIVLPGESLELMQEWVDQLMQRRSPKAWRYNVPPGPMSGIEFEQDMSSTQLAMLALRAASGCHGVRVDREALLGVVEFCLENQDPDGPAYEVPLDGDEGVKKPGQSVQVMAGKVRGFAYNRQSSTRHEKISSGGITCAGTASLIVARALLAGHPRFRKEFEVKVDQSIRDAMMWIQQNWSMERNPRGGGYFYYYLYGLERVGDLQNTLMIGSHYWYNEGAEVLVAAQEENGAWVRDDTHFPADVINTAFALLFLDRATPPIAITGGGH